MLHCCDPRRHRLKLVERLFSITVFYPIVNPGKPDICQRKQTTADPGATAVTELIIDTFHVPAEFL